MMNKYVERRVIDSANFLVENKSTIRKTAKQFNCSKSTTHKDLSERLPKLKQPVLVRKVQSVLGQNKSECHIRGGLATRNKYSLSK